MKHRVAELEGALLDAAVAKALGHSVTFDRDGPIVDGASPPRPYSTHWNTGGQIIESERMEIIPQWITFSFAPDAHWQAVFWIDPSTSRGVPAYGPTILVAAMRAVVMSKLGEEIEL